MIQGASASSDLGFGNLFLSGYKQQMANAAESLRTKGPSSKAQTPSQALTTEQQRQVDELKSTERKVKAHEQAHMAVGGDLVLGGASYTYEKGPDGKRYAVGGEVRIDTSEGRTPAETIPKAQHIRETALAPVDPSPQDRQVAAVATRMEMEARLAVATEKRDQGGEAEARNSYSGNQAVNLYNTIAAFGSSSGASQQVSIYA